MRKQLLVLFCVIACAVASANAAVIATYNFNVNGSLAGTPGTDVSSVTAFNNNTAGGGIVSGNGTQPSGGTYTADGWDNTLIKYVEFSVTPTSPHYLNISSVDMLVNQSDNNSVTQMRVEIFNGATSLGFASATMQPCTPGMQTVSFNFATPLGSIGMSTLTFRIYAQINDSGNNSVEFDNVVVNGLTPIPEPTTVALGVFGLGAVAFGAARRLRRNSSRAVVA